MEKISGRITPQLEGTLGRPSPTIGFPEHVGQSLDEVKLEKSQALGADLAPLPTRQLMDLIGGGRSHDQLRLHVPEAANPFQTSPLGPQQDYFLLKNVVRRSQSDASKKLIAHLQSPNDATSEESIGFMRASLAREHNMLQLLNELMTSMGQIHNRVIGSQEG